MQTVIALVRNIVDIHSWYTHRVCFTLPPVIGYSIDSVIALFFTIAFMIFAKILSTPMSATDEEGFGTHSLQEPEFAVLVGVLLEQ